MSALELRVAAVEDGLDVVFHHDVRIDAVPFDDPLAFQGDAAGLRHEDLAAVDHRTVVVDAHHAAPGAGADQGPKAQLTTDAQRSTAGRGWVAGERGECASF